MATIVMNTDECKFERDAPMLEEYGEDVMCEGWIPQLSLAAESSAQRINRDAKGWKRTKVPIVALPSAPEEVADSIEFVRSTALPQCP
jgi:hypothetical protein